MYGSLMGNGANSLKSSKKHWILDSSIPDIQIPNAQVVRQINMTFRIPFGYTGTALLSREGQIIANSLKETAGRCLGGGVVVLTRVLSIRFDLHLPKFKDAP